MHHWLGWTLSPQRGSQTCVHSGTLILVVAAKHEANTPQFRRHGSDSRASPPYQPELGKISRIPGWSRTIGATAQICSRWVWWRWGVVCTHSHVLPHPITVPFHRTSNTPTHPPPASTGHAASPPSPLKPLASVYRCPELLLAACRRVLHALVRHLLPLQSLHNLSLILPQFVCRLCPASRHTELSLYSYCPPRHGCLSPRTHPLPLHPCIQPSAPCTALGPLTLPRGPTLRFGGPKCSLSPDHCLHAEWTPSPGPACCSLPGPALQEAGLLCLHSSRVLLPQGRSLSCNVDMEIRALEAAVFLHFGL